MFKNCLRMRMFFLKNLPFPASKIWLSSTVEMLSVFKSPSNIYDRAFFVKIVKDFLNFFLLQVILDSK